ncbi:MAG: hypothetical protein KKD28_02325 [Chloroflexi bacterium]|nr:hypothetical protein [Chloroflexota bacterium]MBU1660292.1 hypothetical protein [Chloroflexota bacterium]
MTSTLTSGTKWNFILRGRCWRGSGGKNADRLDGLPGGIIKRQEQIEK